MNRKIINPWKWQDQHGFVQCNDVSGIKRTLFIAGQTSIDAEGNTVHDGDMRAQLNEAIDNLETVLNEAGLAPENVVRLTYYTTDVDKFLEVADVVGPATGGGRMSTGEYTVGRGAVGVP